MAAAILVQFPWIVENNPVLGALLVLVVSAAAMGIPAGGVVLTPLAGQWLDAMGWRATAAKRVAGAAA